MKIELNEEELKALLTALVAEPARERRVYNQQLMEYILPPIQGLLDVFLKKRGLSIVPSQDSK